MDPSHIPDDVWIEIFELLPRRQLAANVQRTCRRFRTLAANPLLRHILWLTPAQIKEELLLWSTRNAMLPRSLCITPRLELDTQTRIWDSIPIPMLTPRKPLYHSIHAQLPLFMSLRTLTISNIAFSEDTCRALQLIPTLRSLRILNSDFHFLSPEERRQRMNLPPVQLAALPITHLCLHKVWFHPDPVSVCHPVRLLICPSLTSLAITWDPSTGLGYQLLVHDSLSQNDLWLEHHHVPAYIAAMTHLATSTHPRASPNLTNIEVRIPLLEDKFFEGLVSLASPPPSALLLPLRVKIHVVKTKLSANDFVIARARLSSEDSSCRALPNVWSYTGPFHALDAFVPIKRHFSHTHPLIHDDALEDLSTPLTQLRLRPPGVPVSSVVQRLELLVWPLKLEHLEVCIHSWDIEILYAIRELCPNVVRVVVRYGEGTMDEDHLITPGSPILSGLKHLHTLRLLHDPRCVKDAVMPRRRGFNALYMVDPLEPEPQEDYSQPAPHVEETPVDIPVDIPLEDCLAGWHRYCPSLRRVQVGSGTKGIAWRRRWHGDAWHKVWVEDVEDPEERGDSDYGWGDGGDDVDEGEIWSEVRNGSA